MSKRLLIAVFTMVLCFSGLTQAPGSRVGSRLARLELTVEGVSRESLIYVPTTAASTPTPVVFVFHGHGGTAGNAARSFDIQKYWPDAIVVYPQGLKTPGQITDPEGNRTGWQAKVGNQNDRDMKFFDALLAKL
ncbi:MAG TPA: esterase, partial [Candidatus Paceibacterota bacterium]|nr:esterase [Candidatus Paceibacterota bacterium]